MNKDVIRQVAVVAAYAATVIVNILANALPINGQNTGEISDRFAIYFVPAGWVFAIWLPIYLGLGAYAIYQATRPQRSNPLLRAIGWPFVVSCGLNILWVLLWHYNLFVATLPVMIALLSTLILIYLRLDVGRRNVMPDMFWLVFAPFSLYLGWITVATIANTTQVLFYLGWNGWGIAPQTWAVIMMAAATVIGGLVAYRRHDLIYLGVLVWAFVGIAFKHAGTSPVAPAAWVAAIATFALAMYALAWRSLHPAGEFV